MPLLGGRGGPHRDQRQSSRALACAAHSRPSPTQAWGPEDSCASPEAGPRPAAPGLTLATRSKVLLSSSISSSLSQTLWKSLCVQSSNRSRGTRGTGPRRQRDPLCSAPRRVTTGTQRGHPSSSGPGESGPGLGRVEMLPVCPHALVPAAHTPLFCTSLPGSRWTISHPDWTLPTAPHAANRTSPLAPPPGSCSQPAPDSPDPTDATALWDTVPHWPAVLSGSGRGWCYSWAWAPDPGW